MTITKEFISAVAPNAAAAKNGADLARKGRLSALVRDGEGTYIGGECAGSGSSAYRCSVDFVEQSAPVFRCSCPSRQIPCKHVLGLMWAFAEGQSFAEGDVPPDIVEKRQKKEQRAAATKEKKDVAESSPRSAASRARSITKKTEAQLAGVQEAEKIVGNIVQAGLGAADAKSVQSYRALVKQLDSYFITGIQEELYSWLSMISGKGETPYSAAVERLCRIQALLARSIAYLTQKLESPESMDTGSEIEERIGYAWKLDELHRLGLFEKDAELVQLCFHVRQEDRQFVDEGLWLSLGSGKIYKTKNYRPFKALKHIRQDDSVFSRLRVPELYIYPGLSMNPRARWESFDTEATNGETRALILAHARDGLADTIRETKNQLRNLMLDEHPVALVRVQSLKKTQDGEYAALDSAGAAIRLRSRGYCGDGFTSLLDKMPPEDIAGAAMLLLFENDVEAGVLSAQPLAVVTARAVTRLVY